jgi:uncharacterized protein (TIGR00369 family)
MAALDNKTPGKPQVPNSRRPLSKYCLLAPGAGGLLPAMKTLPHTYSCFVCGESNPAGLKLRFETDGRTVQAGFRPRSEHVGFKQTVHGGLIATLLDEVMVWACAVQTRRFAFCAELNVRYLAPARPDEDLVATGELTSNRHGKLFEAKAELKNQTGSVLARATGKYLPIKTADAAQLATDFVDDPSWIFSPASP